MQNTTIAAIATAPGAGGIAVVRLSGPESYAVAARVFHPANPNKNVLPAWRAWAAEPDGWFSVLHGEILCRA